MVRLTKIYTKTGDDGTTGLANGQRVSKTDPRVEAYGTVDEANAALGAALLACGESINPTTKSLAPLLQSIQHDLFDLGADLATPLSKDEQPGTRLRIIPSQVLRLEQAIDEHNARLAPLTSFVLPGGTLAASHLHVARTVVRRSERLAIALEQHDSAGVNHQAIVYLNRLSDLLFVLGRVANADGAQDVLWKPGNSR